MIWRTFCFSLLLAGSGSLAGQAVAAGSDMPDALSRAEFEEISPAEFLAGWRALSSSFEGSLERWPMCGVTVQDGGRLAVQVRKLSHHHETRVWPPQEVGFSTDKTKVNRMFKEPTHMMPVGDDWLCAYAYGEFGNRCWLFSKTGTEKALLTSHEVVSLAKVKDRFFVTTYDSEHGTAAFAELITGSTPRLKRLGEYVINSMGGLKILPSPADGTLFFVDQSQLIRWNVDTGGSIILNLRNDWFYHLAPDAHSACLAEGRYWIGSAGVVCAIDPTAGDLAPRLYVPKGWRVGAAK